MINTIYIIIFLILILFPILYIIKIKHWNLKVVAVFVGRILLSMIFFLNYSPLNVLTDCLKWEIPKYRSLVASNSLGYPRSSYG
ncbi:hypothetical protein AT269_07150 [Bacillus cereus]|nr:hypothetical protein AT269_07150 [Bacillus cereus]